MDTRLSRTYAIPNIRFGCKKQFLSFEYENLNMNNFQSIMEKHA